MAWRNRGWHEWPAWFGELTSCNAMHVILMGYWIMNYSFLLTHFYFLLLVLPKELLTVSDTVWRIGLLATVALSAFFCTLSRSSKEQFDGRAEFGIHATVRSYIWSWQNRATTAAIQYIGEWSICGLCSILPAPLVQKIPEIRFLRLELATQFISAQYHLCDNNYTFVLNEIVNT